jgi:hypothetical protein
MSGIRMFTLSNHSGPTTLGFDLERLQEAQRRSVRAGAVYVLGGTASAILLSAVTGNPIVGPAAIGGAILLSALTIWLWKEPVRGVYVLFGAAALLAAYVETGLTDYIGWYLPFFEDIKSSTHIGVIVSPAEVFMTLTLLVWLLKGIAQRNLRFDRGSLMWPLGLYMVMVLVAEGRGLSSGGSLHDSLWELRSQVYMLIAYVLVCNLVKTRAHLTKLLWILLIVAGIRGIEGTFQYLFVLRAQDISTHQLYPHEQSYFFNGFLVLTILLFLYGGSHRMKRVALYLLPFVLVANIANNRRASIAALVISLIVLGLITWMTQPRSRKTIKWIVIVLALVYPPYYLHYQSRTGFLALPARAISSSFHPTANDAQSNQYRVSEDLDIMTTVKSSSTTAVIGYGFGKPMMSPYWLPNIGYVFQYIMPHNSILWVWMRLGTIGYLVFWFLIGSAVIQATQMVRRVRGRALQGIALFILLMLLQQVIISYVDLQWSNYRSMIFTGVLFALISRIPLLSANETQSSTDNTVRSTAYTPGRATVTSRRIPALSER